MKNFIGENAELEKIHSLIKFSDEALANYLADEILTWKFISLPAPSFLGVWETGVKSKKYH